MLRSLTLGNRTFPINLIQGPLAGVSCAPFRALTWRYSQPAFSCTEMISCKTLVHQPASVQQRYIEKSSQEGPVCFQLSSNNPLELAEATRRVTQWGADLIDLNCGCPVKKIRAKGAGSSLLGNPTLLYQLIRAMKSNTHLPVSIKIRVDGGSNEQNNQTIVQVVSDAGADFVVVHGRHWTEGYETSCWYDQIQFFVAQLKIPVIGNGDVNNQDSLKRMLATGCAGVMIGRAGVGQPWLIKQLISEMQNDIFILPTKREKMALFFEHISQLSELLHSEKLALLQARKIGKYYARGFDDKILFIQQLNQCINLKELKTVCENILVN